MWFQLCSRSYMLSLKSCSWETRYYKTTGVVGTLTEKITRVCIIINKTSFVVCVMFKQEIYQEFM